MANEMVERVARAISEVSGRDGHEVSEFGLSDAAAILCARAAIAAMREPTDAMLDGAERTNNGGGYGDEGGIEPDRYDPEEVWQAMIDAALKD